MAVAGWIGLNIAIEYEQPAGVRGSHAQQPQADSWSRTLLPRCFKLRGHGGGELLGASDGRLTNNPGVGRARCRNTEAAF